MGSIMVLAFSTVHAQGEAENIAVPRKPEWTAQVNLAAVPNLPIRPIGSGVCENPKCDGTDNDRCFESCGNKPNSDDIYGCPKPKQWSLTFDDGPSNYTADLLDMLDQANVKATFCVMGAHVRKYPEIVKRAYDAGHHIASHTYSHPHLMSLSNEEIIAEMKATEEAIVDAIGVKPSYMRPPFGEADDRVKGLMKAMGYKILLWNADPTDYNIYKQANVADKIKATFVHALGGDDTGLNAHEDPGFISLQHDLYTQSIAQVPAIISLLRGSQYQLMTSAECLGDAYPYQNDTNNAQGGESALPHTNINAASLPQATSSDSSASAPAPSSVASVGIADAGPNAPVASGRLPTSAAISLTFTPFNIGAACLSTILFSLFSAML
ncbi:unnamed protein product [Umbelopsis ramanniana]